MRNSPNSYALAIDGGGTRCRAVLLGGDAPVVAEGGSANVSSDFEGAARELLTAARTVFEAAGLPSGELAMTPTYIGVAGITGPDMSERLAATLPFHHVQVEDDRPSALRGALGAKDGMIMHCGTGSFAAAQIGAKTRFAGGWGSVLGDQASAQWVGRRALSLTLETVDGLLKATDLSDDLLKTLDGSSGIVAFAGQATPAEIGKLAKRVTQAADGGDKLAIAILTEAADHIANLFRKLGWNSGTTICLTGGIGPFFTPFLPSDIRSDLAPPAGDPLDGAKSLALEFQKECAGECH